METLAELIQDDILSMETISGGGNFRVIKAATASHQFCVKTGFNVPDDFFQAEANGLSAIAETKTIRTPRVYKVNKHGIVMEWLSNVSPTRTHWHKLGESLAQLHKHQSDRFGFDLDGYCGPSPQSNQWKTDGYDFFTSQRLEPQIKMARNRNYLDREEAQKILELATNLDQWIPRQPPSLIHGDLWSGNVLHITDGPALIDPAAHYGWREADIAMTTLFGGFNAEFYDAYESVWPLESGFQERKDLYNLYHLLNHLNLFGSAYYSGVMGIVKQFQ